MADYPNFLRMKRTIELVGEEFGDREFTRKDYDKLADEIRICNGEDILYSFGYFRDCFEIYGNGLKVVRKEAFVMEDKWGDEFIAHRYFYKFNSNRAMCQYEREITTAKYNIPRRIENLEREIKKKMESLRNYKMMLEFLE